MKYELKRVSMSNAFELKLDLYDEEKRIGFDVILTFTKHAELDNARRFFIQLYGVSLPLSIWEIFFAYVKGVNNHDRYNFF